MRFALAIATALSLVASAAAGPACSPMDVAAPAAVDEGHAHRVMDHRAPSDGHDMHAEHGAEPSHGDAGDRHGCADELCGTAFCADCALCIAAVGAAAPDAVAGHSADVSRVDPVHAFAPETAAADPPPPRTA